MRVGVDTLVRRQIVRPWDVGLGLVLASLRALDAPAWPAQHGRRDRYGRAVLVLGGQLSPRIGALAQADAGRDGVVMLEVGAKLRSRPGTVTS